MKIQSMFLAAAAVLGAVLTMPHQAQALIANPAVSAPSVTQDVACRTVRERVVRPGGRVIYRTSRVCTPTFVRPAARCSTVRERIVRPNGTIVFKTVRRCR